MSATRPPRWLGAAYVVALLLHAALVFLILGWALFQILSMGSTANAARESLGMALLVLLPVLLVCLPSTIALLSWWLCRRRGWQPSIGHIGLTTAAAAAFLILFSASYFA